MQAAARVLLPANGWAPRADQMPLWRYLRAGGTRADIVAHRRWGKDEMCLQATAVAAFERIGSYWHMLPEAAQARKAIWDAVNPRTGLRRINEAFPLELRESTRDSDMFIRFKNGSTWQVLGSDNYDSFVGSPPIGVVFSEWSLAKPEAWAYVRPILRENGGFAMFIWTPRGKNHATRSFLAREKNTDWFTMRLPASKTNVFTDAQLAAELRELIDESGSDAEGRAKYLQEYEVEFDAPVPGSYYGDAMTKLKTKGNIGDFPYLQGRKLITSWDLGIDDYTSIWFIQLVAPKKFNIVDFYETGDLGLDQIVAEAFKGKMHWKFDKHYLPHDVKKRELGNGGRSVIQSLRLLGVHPIIPGVPRDQAERVNAVRRVLPQCHFNADTCESGIEHLEQYSKRWNKSMGVWGGPKKDGHDHAADAFGEFAVNVSGLKPVGDAKDKNPNDRYSKLKNRGESLDWRAA